MVAVDVQGKPRLRPPEGLAPEVRAVFVDHVNANDPKHFVRSDTALLVEYATASVMARRAAEALEREGLVVAGRPNPWLVVQEKQVRAMTALAMRLRLAPQSRIDARGAGRTSRDQGPRGIEALTGLGGRDEEE